MSLLEDFDEIAALLSSIDGVTGYAFEPTELETGDAFPQIEVLDEPANTAMQVTWSIIVTLPSFDGRTAMEWFANMHEEITDVVSEFGIVDRITLERVPTKAGQRNVMVLTVRREA